MKLKRHIIFMFSIIIIFTLSFLVGNLIMNKHVDNRNGKEDPLNHEEPGKDIKISNEGERIGPATIIEMRTYYKKCGHTIVETSLPDNELVNKGEDEYIDYLMDNFIDSRLISFSNEKITLWKENNHLCGNHHIIGEMDGYIAVFNIDEKGEATLNTKFTEYPINLLMDIDKERLKEGIIVDSEDELYEVLENFIS